MHKWYWINALLLSLFDTVGAPPMNATKYMEQLFSYPSQLLITEMQNTAIPNYAVLNWAKHNIFIFVDWPHIYEQSETLSAKLPTLVLYCLVIIYLGRLAWVYNLQKLETRKRNTNDKRWRRWVALSWARSRSEISVLTVSARSPLTSVLYWFARC